MTPKTAGAVFCFVIAFALSILALILPPFNLAGAWIDATPAPSANRPVIVNDTGRLIVGVRIQRDRLFEIPVWATVSQVVVGTVRTDGTIEATLPHGTTFNGSVYAEVNDPDRVIDALLRGDQVELQSHTRALIDLAKSAPYAGIVLSYPQSPTSLSKSFTNWIADVAGRLHDERKALIVALPVPTDEAFTTPYDWQVLGDAADAIQIQAPTEATLRWISERVPLKRLQVIAPEWDRERWTTIATASGVGGLIIQP